MRYSLLGSTGLNLSHVSYGAAAIGSVWHTTDRAESIASVHAALAAGVNYIDTAPWYGQGLSESVLGDALADVPRGSYYIGTKVGRYEKEVLGMFDFSAERVQRSVRESLARLKLEYVDIIQVHDVEFCAGGVDQIVHETLPALQEIVKAGLARFIGITGYDQHLLLTILERCAACSPPLPVHSVLTYCHSTLHDNSLADMSARFAALGAGVIAASPMSMGLLVDSANLPNWHPVVEFGCDTLLKACDTARERCRAAGVSLSRLAMAYSATCPGVCTTLFSSPFAPQVISNIRDFTAALSDAEAEVLAGLLADVFPRNRDEGRASWEGRQPQKYFEQLTAARATERAGI